MSTQPSDLTATTPLEDALIGYARAHAALADAHHRVPDGWRYGTSSHLLLAQGRLFTPGPLPGEIGTLPDQFCFRNAAITARRHHLDYAEGLAAFLLGDTLWCLPHAWCAQDGIAIDRQGAPAKASPTSHHHHRPGPDACRQPRPARRLPPPVLQPPVRPGSSAVANLDEAAMRRWPGYAPAVRARGIGAVFALPLQFGAARLGAMDVFRAEPGPLTLPELRFALLFAVVAVNTLLDGQDDSPAGSVGSALEEQVTRGAELFQAQGMVMAELGITITEAMARIRAYTFAENRRLHDVATDIVHGRLHLDR